LNCTLRTKCSSSAPNGVWLYSNGELSFKYQGEKCLQQRQHSNAQVTIWMKWENMVIEKFQYPNLHSYEKQDLSIGVLTLEKFLQQH
jgi:hypothetical protein